MQGESLATQPTLPKSDPIFPSIFDPPTTESSPKPSISSLMEPIPKRSNTSFLGKPIFSSQLSKKSKTLGYNISRHYFLFPTYLAYASSDNHTKVKKYTELKGLKVNIIAEEPKNNKGQSRYIFLLFKSNIPTKLFTDSKTLADTWRIHLKNSCIMLNFSDHYTIRETLGKGANGKVVLAIRNEDGKKFAVKIFEKVRLISQLKGFDSIVNEVEALRTLNHESIIKLHEVYESGNSIHLVLDYVEGGELYTKLRDTRIYTEKECATIMKNILEPLSYLHQRKFVHRDIKPENIVLASKNSVTDIKLIDFGFAIDYSIPQHIKRCGTPGYIAPEVLNSKPDMTLSDRLDVFSAGAIFYQLLVGSKLFSGSSVDEIVKKNKVCFINTVKLDIKKISDNARDLLMKMIDKDPLTRITSTEALKHPFFTSQPESTADLSNSGEDLSRHETSRYSFDMICLKELNKCSRSKIIDSWGSIHITSHIPMDANRLHRAPTDQDRSGYNSLEQSPKLGYIMPTSNFTSAFLDENSVEEMKSGEKSPSPTSGFEALSNEIRRARGSGLHTAGASPFHKAAIMNNLKRIHMEQGEGLSPEDKTFSDYFKSFDSKMKAASPRKRNSMFSPTFDSGSTQ